MHKLSKTLTLIIFALLLTGCTPKDQVEPDDTSIQETIQVNAPTPTPSNTNSYIQVSNQKPSRAINIGTVSATGKNFIIIFRASTTDAHAEILGKSQPITGSQSDLNILLDKPVSIGDQLSAVLFSDNGNSSFDPTEDTMLTDKSGNYIQANFTIIN